jgi:peptidoglycan/LPS O-acetylase OafA/YrhL
MGMIRPGCEGPRPSATIVSWLALVLLAVLSIRSLVTPAPPDGSDPGEFSVDRALEHVSQIAREPHPIGTPENARVREYIVAALTSLGLEPRLQSIRAPDYFGSRGRTVDVVNVMARIPGSSPTRAVLVMGHYDSVPTTPGANDDAAAIGVMLEVGRVLLQGPGLRNDVILLFTDGEEPAPRFGSAAFVGEHPWAAEVGFVVNLEAAGGSGPSTLMEATGPGSWSVMEFAAEARDPIAFSFLTQTTELLGKIGTDFDTFAERGVPGLHFAYLRNSPIYHTPEDSIENVDPGSVGHHGTNVLGALRVFGNVDLTEPPEAEKSVFFNAARAFFVRYPAAWSVPLAVLAAVVFAAALLLGSRRRGLRASRVLSSALAVLAGVLLAALVTTLAWWLVTGVRKSPGVAESYAYLCGLLAIAGGVGLLMGQKRSTRDQFAGATLLWLVLALATALWLPGMSYLFLWPVLGASIALVLQERRWVSDRWLRPVSVVLVAAPALVLLAPPVDTFFQMAMPRPGNPDSEMVTVVGASILLASLAFALIAPALNIDRRESPRQGPGRPRTPSPVTSPGG